MDRKHQRTLALILAGGKGGRLEVLTEKRAKPAMPYAGVYRLIDFALSNCMHSGLSDVWVIEQYQPHTLNEHLANGRPWDLDRTYGGLQVLPPYETPEDAAGGFAQGNADAIYRHRQFISEFAPDILLVLSADHIYKLDFREVIEQHVARAADVTMVTTRVAREEASRFGIVEVNRRGRVTNFAYKPEQPPSDVATTEVFVYHAPKLLQTLDELATAKRKRAPHKDSGNQEAGETSLQDFGHELLPQLVRDGRAFEFRLEGYWRDVGTVESYWKSHMDLLSHTHKLGLDDPAWPILTFGSQRLPARIHESARITNSLISPGCTIHGQVIRSVLAPGVVVERGATVRDSVLLHETVVRAGAKVECAILDDSVMVGERAVVGAPPGKRGTHAGRPLKVSDTDLTMVGWRARIQAGAQVARGARVKPVARVLAKK